MIFSTDNADWEVVFKSGDAMKSELVKNEIENNDMDCILLNKKDTMYPMFGLYLLHVRKADAAVAKIIIDVFMNKNDAETE
ncbi:MAG: hypothetical protein ACI9IP_002978 [Arcticibacterium sp.]|jgi:hypothetical protein